MNKFWSCKKGMVKENFSVYPEYLTFTRLFFSEMNILIGF